MPPPLPAWASRGAERASKAAASQARAARSKDLAAEMTKAAAEMKGTATETTRAATEGCGWAFEKAPLSASSLECIARLGFARPTAVQAATIPLFMAHKDVVVEAVTGSGKTLAFLIPIVEILQRTATAARLAPNQVGAIVVSPTRELAVQTKEALDALLVGVPHLRSAMLIGGTDVAHDAEAIGTNGCNIIVATPGRLLDTITRMGSAIVLGTLEVLVLDEADRLLSLGFERTINTIIGALPKQRRTGLFSATMSDALSELIRTGLRNPVRVTVRVESVSGDVERKTPQGLESRYAVCNYEARLPLVFAYLEQHAAKKAIVYFATCAAVEYFSRAAVELAKAGLISKKHSVLGLHGRIEPKKRTRLYGEFTSAPRATLFCTDLAARGLDFSDVDLVIQYEAPQDATTFVHRSGRTARSGRTGEGLLLVSEHEDAYIDFLRNRKVPITELTPDQVEGDACKALLLTSTGQSFFEPLRQINTADRAFFDKSVRAFVAFIRFYQEHQAKYIFRVKDLEVGLVAKSFGLLRLPRMPEFKALFGGIGEATAPGGALAGFVESPTSLAAIAYKDPARNKQREAMLKTVMARHRERGAPAGAKASERARPQAPYARKSAKPNARDDRCHENTIDMGELKGDWEEFKRAKRERSDR